MINIQELKTRDQLLEAQVSLNALIRQTFENSQEANKTYNTLNFEMHKLLDHQFAILEDVDAMVVCRRRIQEIRELLEKVDVQETERMARAKEYMSLLRAVSMRLVERDYISTEVEFVQLDDDVVRVEYYMSTDYSEVQHENVDETLAILVFFAVGKTYRTYRLKGGAGHVVEAYKGGDWDYIATVPVADSRVSSRLSKARALTPLYLFGFRK